MQQSSVVALALALVAGGSAWAQDVNFSLLAGFNLSMDRNAEGKVGFRSVDQTQFEPLLGPLVIPQVYDWVDTFEWYEDGKPGQASAQVGLRFGVIDSTGKVIVPLEYDYASPCSEKDRVIRVFKGGKSGLMDCAGNQLVPMNYDFIADYQPTGTAAAVKDGGWGVVDGKGRELVPFGAQVLELDRSGFAIAVDKDGACNYSAHGTRLPPPFRQTDATGSPAVGGLMEKNGKRALFLPNGEQVLPYEFSDVSCRGTLCVLSKGGEYGLFDVAKRKQVIPFEWAQLDEYGGIYLASHEDDGGPFSYLGPGGEPLFEQTFDDAGPFEKNGLAVVKKGKTWGLIDRQGKLVVPFEIIQGDGADEAGAKFLDDGLVTIRKKSGWGVIDRAGKVIIPFEYRDPIARDGISPFSRFSSKDRYVVVRDSAGKYGVLDAKGAWRISLGKFDDLGVIDSTGRRNTLYVDVKEGEKRGLWDLFTNTRIMESRYQSIVSNTSNDDHYKVQLKSFGKWGVFVFALKKDFFNDSYEVDEWHPETQRFVLFKENPNASPLEPKGKYGLQTLDGKVVVPVKYDELNWLPRSGNLYLALLDGKVGFLDKDGNTKIPFNWELPRLQGTEGATYTPFFDDGAIALLRNGQLELVDLKGKVIARGGDLEVRGAHRLSNEPLGPLLLRRATLLGEKDEETYNALVNGKLYTSVGYDVLEKRSEWKFSEGLIAAKRDGMWGFLDETGTEAVPFKFLGVSAFKRGVAYAQTGPDTWSLINRKGERVRMLDFRLNALRKAAMKK